MAADGTGEGWAEDSPADTAKVSTIPVEIRDLRKGLKLRLTKEHVEPADGTDGGEHIKGSAMVYQQNSAPTTKPDGVTALDNDDQGRLWWDAKVLREYDGVTNGWGRVGCFPAYAILQEAHPSGTQSGSATAGAWNTRVLNTERTDPDDFINLDTVTGVFNFKTTGIYEVRAVATAFGTAQHKTRLRRTNNTPTTEIVGLNAFGNTTGGGSTTGNNAVSILEGILVVSLITTTYELQSWIGQLAASNAADTMGARDSSGESELLSQIQFKRISKV